MTTPKTGAEAPVRPARELAVSVPCPRHDAPPGYGCAWAAGPLIDENIAVCLSRVRAAIEARDTENARACRALEGERDRLRGELDALQAAGERTVSPEAHQSVQDRLYAEIHRLRGELAEANADAKRAVEIGLGQAGSLVASRSREEALEEALEEIAMYETDWTKGTAANVGALQYIAERALAALPGTATAEPVVTPPAMPLFPDPRTVCAPCDGTGRETGLGGYDEPCRVCNGTGRAPAPTSPETPVGPGGESEGGKRP